MNVNSKQRTKKQTKKQANGVTSKQRNKAINNQPTQEGNKN